MRSMTKCVLSIIDRLEYLLSLNHCDGSGTPSVVGTSYKDLRTGV